MTLSQHLKRNVTSAVRAAHLALAPAQLPNKLSIYFHPLEKADRPAFRDAITGLADRGYRFVTPDGFVSASPDDKVLFVSFDDNYNSWHESLPLLDDLQLKATFYVNSGVFADRASTPDITAYFDRNVHTGERLTLTTTQLREMHTAGHRIAAHTRNHFNLGALPRAQWDDEILGDKDDLEDVLGEAVEDFSYPFGMPRFFSEDLRAYCQDIGFKTIANATPGMLFAGVEANKIPRTAWRFDTSEAENLRNLCVDARLFTSLTGRSAVG